MRLRNIEVLELPPSADMHVHLRQGAMMDFAVRQIRSGGVNTVMLFYSSITPDVIVEAAAAGITGVKVYPQGVTTNSALGITSYDEFFPVFAAMEKHDLVLNLHGEVPSGPRSDITDLTAEEAFLPTLIELNQRFPKLRIVLEHCSTVAAIAAVRACGPSVAGTITAHHLFLTSEDWHSNPFAFCKPVAKTPADRDALIRAVCSGDSKFFFGSDSAPHPTTSKQQPPSSSSSSSIDNTPKKPAAGVFTQPFATQYIILALENGIEKQVITEEDVTQERLEEFLSTFGRRFYKLGSSGNGERGKKDEIGKEEETGKKEKIVLERKGARIPDRVTSADGNIEVGLIRGGDEVFSLRWASSALALSSSSSPT